MDSLDSLNLPANDPQKSYFGWVIYEEIGIAIINEDSSLIEHIFEDFEYEDFEYFDTEENVEEFIPFYD